MKRMLVAAIASTLCCSLASAKPEPKAEPKPAPAVAAPSEATNYSAEAAADACVVMREACAECKVEFATAFVDARMKMVPGFKEKTKGQSVAELRKIAEQEFVADGAGPVGARRLKCAAMVPPDGKMKVSPNEMATCFAKPCAERVSCMMPFIMNPKSWGPAAK